MVASNASFDAVVNQAHEALERQPGVDVSLSPEVRAIASSAKKIVLNVRKLRNDVGTGHGRGRINKIDEERTTVVVDATALWTRWALRRLEHVLLREADNLIAELSGAIVTRRSLAKHLEGAMLPDQPPEMQRALGVAFAQRASGGTFVAREAGVDGPSSSEDLDTWPPEYRLGIAEGLVFSRAGFVSLTSSWVPTIVSVLAPIPPSQLKTFLRELLGKVEQSGVSPGLSVEDLCEIAETVKQHTSELPQQVQLEWEQLACAINRTADDENS